MLLGLRPLAALSITMLVLITQACSSSELPKPTATPVQTTTPTPTPIPFDPVATLKTSGQVMQGLNSFHLQLHHGGGSTELLEGFQIDEVEADVVKPDKMSIALSGTFGGEFAIRAQVKAIGDTTYMTNPLTGQWERIAAGVSPSGSSTLSEASRR